jgi:hypothetical protein
LPAHGDRLDQRYPLVEHLGPSRCAEKGGVTARFSTLRL